MRKCSFGLLPVLFVVSVGCAQSLKIEVDGGGVERKNVPVVAILTGVKDAPPSGPATLAWDMADSATVLAQVGNLGDGRVSVRWIEPRIAAGQKKNYTLTPGGSGAAGMFSFHDGDGFRDLLYADKPVVRQMIKYDAEDHANTFKPFDHVYTPVAATQPSTQPAETVDKFYRPLTKGPGGQYTHHRGIFFGFNKTAYGDFWHCNKGESQRHTGFETRREWAGPLASKMVSKIDWVGNDGHAKFRETREATAWRVGEKETVLDYEITLETLTGKPEALNGDAHHAGFHFRASNDLADAADNKRRRGAVHYVFPEAAKLTKDDVWGGAAWVNANFELFGRRYSVTHMDSPDNPDPTTYSTRGYGRFGAFFTGEVTPDKPLKVKYRLVVRDITGGATTQPSKAQVEAEYENFAKPVTVKLLD